MKRGEDMKPALTPTLFSSLKRRQHSDSQQMATPPPPPSQPQQQQMSQSNSWIQRFQRFHLPLSPASSGNRRGSQQQQLQQPGNNASPRRGSSFDDVGLAQGSTAAMGSSVSPFDNQLSGAYLYSCIAKWRDSSFEQLYPVDALSKGERADRL